MVRVGTWNTHWASPKTKRGRSVSAALAAPDCDILCVTEGYAELLPSGGHIIDAGDDWGYVAKEGRRKVLLWSKQPWSGPWSEIDPSRSDWIPQGRFVAGTTQTDLGPVVVIGVCIPWERAHVDTGREDRKPWEDHERWLKGFATRPCGRNAEMTIVLGDFNQRIPRTRVGKRTYELLLHAFEGFTIATVGELAQAPGQAIDHIAHTSDLTLIGDIGVWPKQSDHGLTLSDHFGVWGDFERNWASLRRRSSLRERMNEPFEGGRRNLTPEELQRDRELGAAWRKFYKNGDETGLVALGIFPKGEPEDAD